MIRTNTQQLLIIIAIFAFLNGLFVVASPVYAAPTGTVKIMPLGDSITVGYPGVDGYRKDLYLDLVNSGFNVNFVGSQSNGTGLDNDNEGHVGWSADEIRDNVYGWLMENPADVVLLHIGTNDVESGQDVAGIVLEVGGILDNIDLWASDNGVNVTVVLARIILRSDNVGWNQTTVAFDDALEAMALARIANGDHIITVDMEHALSYPADLTSDGIHPTSAGYAKMANVWYGALDNLLSDHSLTVNYVGSGVVTRLPDQSAYSYGATVSLSAQANIGWAFSGWSGDLNGSTNPATITMDSNKTVTAAFTQNQYTLTVTVDPLGTGSVSADISGPYHYGDIITLTPNSNSSYSFSNWSGDGTSGAGNTRVVTITGNMAVTATFIQNYKLTISANLGTTTPTVGEYWYSAGSSVNISASSPTAGANERYTWLGWSGSGFGSYNGTDKQVTITMNGPVIEAASWGAEYKLTLSSNSGTTNPSIGEHWYEAGTPVSISASAPTTLAGTRVTWIGWNGSGASSYSGTTNLTAITMNEPITETALWKSEYKLTISTDLGTSEPSVGDYWFDAGTSVNVESSPPTTETGVRYVCTGWSGTGSVPVSSGSSAVTFVINAPSTIAWNWKTQYLVSFDINPSGSGSTSPSGMGVWQDAGSHSISATPNYGYKFSSWTSNTENITLQDEMSSSTTATISGTGTLTANFVTAPAPTATPQPTHAPSPTSTPSPSPTASPTPSASPSSTPVSTPNGSNSSVNASLLYGGIIAVVVVGVILGFFAIKKSKK